MSLRIVILRFLLEFINRLPLHMLCDICSMKFSETSQTRFYKLLNLSQNSDILIEGGYSIETMQFELLYNII